MNLKQEIQELINKLTNDEISISKGLTIAKRLNNKIKNKKLENFILGEMEEKYDDDTLPEYRLVFGESTFEFKYIVDGNYINDDSADRYQWNEFAGSENAVLEL